MSTGVNKIDQFESVFRAAAKEQFEIRPVEIRSVLCLSDQEGDAARSFGERVRGFLGVLGPDLEWRDVPGSETRSVEQVLGLIETVKPDLVCTYRNLHSTAWKYPYSLGEVLDVLTQHTRVPILVTPHPEAGKASEHALRATGHVMAVTSHLTGEHRLVNTALHFTEPKGLLHLVHIESDTEFERMIDAVSKMPAFDTAEVRAKLSAHLLKEPSDYIRSCRAVLGAAGVEIEITATVEFGHRVNEVRRAITAHAADLLVFNTNDEGQLAMHGLAYSLAVELREIPLLML